MGVAYCYKMSALKTLLAICFLFHSSTSEQPQLPTETPSVLHTRNEGKHDTRLSILFLHSMYPSHFLNLVALGAELVSRGHRVTSLGPIVETYEHLPEKAKSRGIEFISADFIPLWVYKQDTESGKHRNNTNILTMMYSVTNVLFNSSENGDNYLFKMKKIIDTMKSDDYDYVVSDITVLPLMHYMLHAWKDINIMIVMASLPIQPQYIIPWPYPRFLSPSTDNMSFFDRLLNTIIYNPLERATFVLVSFILKIDKHQGIIDYITLMVEHPVIFNSVIGFDWPKTRLPLQHYVGPMFLQPSPPLDPVLVNWLSSHLSDSKIIYISMGTTGEVTDAMTKAFVELSKDYIIVWSLRESNRDILNSVSINEDRIYISSWISQLTMLQHPSVAVAIVHCGINGVLEALYYSVPVICFPNAFDQFDIARRIESQGLGLSFSPTQVTMEDVIESVHKLRADHYREQVRKVSCLLRAGGGVKKGADLVELYADVGHDHGIPSFIRYKWSWIQYYNVDVWLIIISIVIIIIWGCSKVCGRCCKCCCRARQKTKRD